MKTKKGNNEKKAADKISLRYCEEEKTRACSLCHRKFSAWQGLEGLEFVLEGGARVCSDCVKQAAPDVYLTWREVARWNEATTSEAFEKGVERGQRYAAERILAAIDEPVIERIKRVCRVDFKATPADEVPF
jgi:hypothetical protein